MTIYQGTPTRASWLGMAVLLLGVAAGAEPGFACADGVACAVVRETADGFTALREKPNAASFMRQKLRPYDIVVVYVDSCDPNPAWTYVVSVPRLDGEYDMDRKDLTTGYAKSTLLIDAACPVSLPQ